MYQQYDKVALDELHKTLLGMLKELDRVCQKYNVDYFLAYGSLIGAVRHNGFIPWDDDVDVFMLREDFERLCAVPESEWANSVYLVKPTDDVPSNCEIYPRLYRRGTVFEPEEFNQKYVSRSVAYRKREIWLDIFMYDFVDSPELAKKNLRIMNRFAGLYKLAKFNVNIPKGTDFQNTIRWSLKKCLHHILNFVHQPELLIYKKYLSTLKKLEGSRKYLVCFESEVAQEVCASIFPAGDFFPVKRVKFEDISVSIQNNYHEALNAMYGDYMVIPPTEKQVNHPPRELDFGDGRGNIMCCAPYVETD